MDPENPVQNTGATRSGWITPFRSAIQKYYPADDVTKSWAHGVAAALEGSTCPPHTKYYMMMLGPVTSHLVPLWSGEAKDAAAEMAVAKAELETQIAESEKKK